MFTQVQKDLNKSESTYWKIQHKRQEILNENRNFTKEMRKKLLELKRKMIGNYLELQNQLQHKGHLLSLLVVLYRLKNTQTKIVPCIFTNLIELEQSITFCFARYHLVTKLNNLTSVKHLV